MKYISTDNIPTKQLWVPLCLTRSIVLTNDKNKPQIFVKQDKETSNQKHSFVFQDLTQAFQEENKGKPAAILTGNQENKSPCYPNTEITSFRSNQIKNVNPIFGENGSVLSGLYNLGNTYYMNTILQCLCDAPFLPDYFNLTYQDIIGRSNLLGHKGKVAEELGLIMNALWAGQHRNISTKDFKITIGNINGHFAGDCQQDPYELLLFLVRGLHEDL